MIRWGMIGCGSVTELKSAPAYNKISGFQLNAVSGRSEIKVKDYAQRHGIGKVYTNASELIQAQDIDAVYIATPPDSHKHFALQVAAARKICCIEKPMALNYSQCQEIVEAFRQHNTPLFVAYYRRSLPSFKRIRQWLDENRIGEIRHVEWHLMRPPNNTDKSGHSNWRTDAAIAPGGYFDDLASHGIDLICWLLGPVESAKGVSTRQQKLYSAKDAVSACWLHRSGATGSASWNFGCASHEDKLTLFGSEGRIECAIFGCRPVRLINRQQTIEELIGHPHHIQWFHIENMREHLAGTLIHPSTGESAAHTTWVMDQILSNQ